MQRVHITYSNKAGMSERGGEGGTPGEAKLILLPPLPRAGGAARGGSCQQHGSPHLPPPGSSVKVNLPHSAKSIGGGDLITLAGAPALPISFFFSLPHILSSSPFPAPPPPPPLGGSPVAPSTNNGSDLLSHSRRLRSSSAYRHHSQIHFDSQERRVGAVGGWGVRVKQVQDQNPISEIQWWW